jgi:ATP-dependent DNA helicase RecG
MSPHTPLAEITRLSKEHKEGLKKLGLFTVHDLLFYFPFRYADDYEEKSLANGKKGESVTLYGILEKVQVRRSFRGHTPLTEAKISDNSGTLRLIWFHQPYIGKMYGDGARVKIMGTLSEDAKGFFLSNPHIEKAPAIVPHLEESLFTTSDASDAHTFLIPIYRETKGVTSYFIYHLIKKCVEQGALQEIDDPLPEEIRKALSLPSQKEALLYTHFPKQKELTIVARKRFAFQEIFLMKLLSEKERSLISSSPAHIIKKDTVKSFLERAPFTPTNAQKTAIQTMTDELAKGEPMNRLLEGDVGSGKTFVALALMYAVSESFDTESKMPLQTAYMAPTEILAKQHFESLCKEIQKTKLTVSLLTSKGALIFPSKTNLLESTHVSKAQLKKWLADGRVTIVIGTHALIQKSVSFKHLALVIVDEQHRFGVKQRKLLLEKRNSTSNQEKIPHLLSMSATPIPRTLALTLFGDLDLSVLDELPQGRKSIQTSLVTLSGRKAMYEHIRSELLAGRQAYVICQRIEKSEEEKSLSLRSVEEEATFLAEEIFPEFIVDVIHGKMKGEEKDEAMKDFLEKKSHILVATSVIEVGVNIPNASVILIEGADRFGLAQLHQLRGRVGRSDIQSYCYLATQSESEKTMKRLGALMKAKNGFELAEIDMKERGIGTLSLGKQWGVSDIAMEALQNPKLVELAGKYAKELIQKDKTLSDFPLLATLLEEREKFHME